MITLHHHVHLRFSNARVAATGTVCVFVTATASPVKAVLSLQLESQDIGKSQAVTVQGEGLQKEPSTLQGSKRFCFQAITARLSKLDVNATVLC